MHGACGDLVPLPAAGKHLGAPQERFAIMFIDDMHLAPMCESNNMWSFLRMLIDQVVFPLAPVAGQRKFAWAPVKHKAYVVAMTSSYSGGEGARRARDLFEHGFRDSSTSAAFQAAQSIKARCLTSFVHINMLTPARSDTLAILSTGLHSHFFRETCCSVQIMKALDPIALATVLVIESLGEVLRPTSRIACAYEQFDLRMQFFDVPPRRGCVSQAYRSVLVKNI